MRWSLAVTLDVTVNPPIVTDVLIMQFNNQAPYKPYGNHGPRAVLTEIEARSHVEAAAALKGIIEHDEDLAWVREWPEIRQFLNPSPVWG